MDTLTVVGVITDWIIVFGLMLALWYVRRIAINTTPPKKEQLADIINPALLEPDVRAYLIDKYGPDSVLQHVRNSCSPDVSFF